MLFPGSASDDRYCRVEPACLNNRNVNRILIRHGQQQHLGALHMGRTQDFITCDVTPNPGKSACGYVRQQCMVHIDDNKRNIRFAKRPSYSTSRTTVSADNNVVVCGDLWQGEQSDANSWAGVFPLPRLSWLVAGPAKITVTKPIIGHRNDPLIIEPPASPTPAKDP